MNNRLIQSEKIAIFSLSPGSRSVKKISISLLLTFGLMSPVLAEIKFDEVTQKANINHAGATYGASWGDFNNDGWPDIWVGNHDDKPSLYLNKQDGTFENVIDKVWSANPNDDTHGAAWADFDNDGDQDLIELVGGSTHDDGSMCIGCGRNLFFVNQNGVLQEKSKEYGLDHIGLARSPLWFDVDKDGKLDLIVVNTREPGAPASTVYLQKNKRFVKANEELTFRDKSWTRRDKVWAAWHNLQRFNPSIQLPLMHVHHHLESAQLASLSEGAYLDLILFSSPTRIFSLIDGSFNDITGAFAIPGEVGISDVAIEDFNGDGKNDMYLMKGPFLEPDVIQVNANEIKGTLTGLGGGQPKRVSFKTSGALDISISPTWLGLHEVFIGQAGRHPDARSFSLSPEDAAIDKSAQGSELKKVDGVSFHYDSETSTWVVSNSLKSKYVDFIVRSKQSIENLQTANFKPFKESGVDTILMQNDGGFTETKLTAEIGSDSACYSIVSGDFDNDMDIDLYMVCTGPVTNLPNRLLENDGKGNFHLVKNAGGAEGSQAGRGDVVAAGDFDRDGFLDLFVTNGTDPSGPFVADGPHQLFRNQGNENNWLEIDLIGVKSNRDGIGARVIIDSGNVKQAREQRGGMHRITQNHQRLHFGLGKNSKVEHVTIFWPSGVRQELENVAANQILQIRENN